VMSPALTILHSVAEYDNGEYRCRVTAGCGSVYTNPAQLRVITPDFDGDGDVDSQDFGHLQECFTGGLSPVQDPACKDARMDSDSDIDESDAARFLSCMSGPGQPYDIHCLD
jgi:hypothetical protein